MVGLLASEIDDVRRCRTTKTATAVSTSTTLANDNNSMSLDGEATPLKNKVHRMATLFSSLQQQQQRVGGGGNSGRLPPFSSPAVANCDHGDERATDAADPRHRRTTTATATSVSSYDNGNSSRAQSRSRSTETSSSGRLLDGSTSGNGNGQVVHYCDLKLLDNKSKFTSAKALFETLERQSREQRRTTSQLAPTSAKKSHLVSTTSAGNMQQNKSRASALSASCTTISTVDSAFSVSTPPIGVANCHRPHQTPKQSEHPTPRQTDHQLPRQSEQQHRPRLLANREREEWSFDKLERKNDATKVGSAHGPPPPVPPKPKVSDSPAASDYLSRVVGCVSNGSCGAGAAANMNSSVNSAASSKLGIKGFNDSVTNDVISSPTSAAVSSSITQPPRHQSQINDVACTSSSNGLVSSNCHSSAKDSVRRTAVIGANSPASVSKFLNSYSNASCPNTSASSAAVAARKYPRLTQTLNMEQQKDTRVTAAPNADGSVVTLIGSLKPNCSIGESSSNAYEPYWRQPAWHSSRRYGDGAAAVSSVEDTATRNYALRPDSKRASTKLIDENLDSGVSSDSTSSATIGSTNGGHTTVVWPPPNQTDGGKSGLVVRLNDGGASDMVDFMTREEASVLLSPATRQEVLLHEAAAIDDVQCLPSSYAVPHDAVDTKRLSMCSVDGSSTTNGDHDAHSTYSAQDAFNVHWMADGHFCMEIPGLCDEETPPPSMLGSFAYKKPSKVSFSVHPIKVFSTYSGIDYDRRNEDVDPVAASAEYELERRLEKMDVFDVDVDKGNDGLGFSIIGMGVGADAGLEKLGIFVKSITVGGAVHRDGRIQVCDQIVEVDSKCLVGVSQSYAASVLRSTSGTVRFKIGREKNLDLSEIAHLIRQSLEHDRLSAANKEVVSKRQSDPLDKSSHVFTPPPRPAGWGAARESPLPSTDSVFTHEDETPEQLVDNPHIEQLMTQLRKQRNVEVSSTIDDDDDQRSTAIDDVGASDLSESATAFQLDSSASCSGSAAPASLDADINRLLNDSLLDDDRVTHFPSTCSEPKSLSSAPQPTSSSYARRSKSPPIGECDSSGNSENEFVINRRIGTLEVTLVDIKKEAEKYQNLLVESQEQYSDLEKKYSKAKKVIRDYQEREKSLLEREEEHLRHLREKDQQYTQLLKQLNEKVAELEKHLSDAHRKRASLAERSSTSTTASAPVTDISPALAYLPSKKLESEHSPKICQPSTSSAVESFKQHVNSSVDDQLNNFFGVPETEILDSSFAKSKVEAVKQSVIMSARQLPSRHIDAEFNSHVENMSASSRAVSSTSAMAAILSPTKGSHTSSGSPLTPRRLTQVLWMRKKANKDLDAIRNTTEFDKVPEVFQWNCEDVCKFLKTLGLEKYSPEFSINRVDGCKLLQLDGAKLKSMGIQNHTDRALIKKRVKDIKTQIDRERKILGKEYKKYLKVEKDKKAIKQ